MAPVAYESGGNEMHAAAQFYLWNQKSKLGHALSEEDKKSFPHICPDFVMEIRSSSDSLRRLKAKMEEYIENGCRLGFLIDPFQQRPWCMRPAKCRRNCPAFSRGCPVLRCCRALSWT